MPSLRLVCRYSLLNNERKKKRKLTALITLSYLIMWVRLQSYLWCVCISCTSAQTPGTWRWRRWHSRNCWRLLRSYSDTETIWQNTLVIHGVSQNFWTIKQQLCLSDWLKISSLRKWPTTGHLYRARDAKTPAKAQHGKRWGLKVTWVKLQMNTTHTLPLITNYIMTKSYV